jgi:hypothetical protein
MFANCQLGGMNLGFPDVCNTPLAAGAPVPVPYPNLSTGMTAIPTAPNILIECMPAHNLVTEIPMSQGDDTGVELGVASGLVMGPTETIIGSFTVMFEGSPASKMTSMTGHNGISMNCPGLTLVPAQFTVLILS